MDDVVEAVTAMLNALEDAMVEKAAKDHGTSRQEIEKQWNRYQKLKSLAREPGTEHEGQTALRRTIITAVRAGLG